MIRSQIGENDWSNSFHNSSSDQCFKILYEKLGSVCQTNVPLKSTRRHNTNKFKKMKDFTSRQTELCSKQSESYKCNARSNQQTISDEILNIEQKVL